MNTEELNALTKTIIDRGNPKYTTPSGAFLELLREYAKIGKIKEISESSVVYFESYPEVKQFIAARIPGILVNHYFTIREDLNYDNFIKFSINNENWADSVKQRAFSPNLFVDEVENVINSANNFEE